MKYASVAKGYANLWAKMKISPGREAVATSIAKKLHRHHERYASVAGEVGCPWWFVAIVHHLESGGNFQTHLHNGDPLSARTRHVPAGRPTTGNPPFSWEVSARDALYYQNIHKVESWEIPRALFELEKYNGLGYYGKINSPYLWSFSNLYTRGKYISDGRYSSSAISAQCGAAVILRKLIDLGFVNQEGLSSMEQLKASILPFGAIAPIIVKSLGGPLAELAIKALAEAFGTEPKDAAVAAKVKASPLREVLEGIANAEETMKTVAPETAPPIPGEIKAPAEEPGPIAPEEPEKGDTDSFFGGDYLKGAKTIIGTVLVVIGYAAQITGWVDPDTGAAIVASGLGMGVIGIVAKIERYAKWIVKVQNDLNFNKAKNPQKG